jgi:hypothetical protein
MALYASSPALRFRQMTADAGVAVWAVLWWLVSRLVVEAIDAVAEPARRTAQAAERLRGDLGAAADSTGSVPVAGPELRRPFDSAVTTMDQIVVAAQDQVTTIERLAAGAGLLVFLLPVALVVLFWLPSRIRFARRSGALRRLGERPEDLELLALRALATQPPDRLAAISKDPVGDWRDRNWPVVVALAGLERASVGLPVPAQPRERPADAAN